MHDERRSHPENFPDADADYANKCPPEPHSFDELADGPDPVVVQRKNKESTREAIRWCVGTIVASAAVSFFLALAARLSGGPLCGEAGHVWLCSRGWLYAWGFGSCVVPVVGLLGCMAFMLSKLRNYLRWRPWMGAFWVLVPHSMVWMTMAMQAILLGD